MTEPTATISTGTPAGLGFRKARDRVVEAFLLLAALVAVFTTIAIVIVLVAESLPFFKVVSLKDFLTDTMWIPLFAEPRYGVLPLVAGTLVTTLVALAVAIPAGTIIAIYLSEFAPYRLRETIKPALELLGAVPTVVYGYFALMVVTPLLQKLIPGLPGFNMLSAGLVIGIMIIPYVASVSEDAMRAVPNYMREGSYAMGATRFQTAIRVVVPGALSGIAAAYILGISRAVGETMVVAIAAGLQPNLTWDPTEPAATITAFIVQVSLGDLPHDSIGYQSIFAVGLVLMLMTLIFNIAGFSLTRKFRETMVVAIAAGLQPNLTWDPTEPAATITAFIVQVSLGDLPHDSIGYQSIFAVGLVLMLMTLIFNIAGFSLTRKFRETY